MRLENMIAYIIHYTSISLQVFSCSLHVHFQLNAHVALLCHKISQLLQLNDGHSHSIITKFCEGQAQSFLPSFVPTSALGSLTKQTSLL